MLAVMNICMTYKAAAKSIISKGSSIMHYKTPVFGHIELMFHVYVGDKQKQSKDPKIVVLRTIY